MKIFVSWSGEESRNVAKVFDNWLPKVLQSVDTWISDSMEKGIHWNEQINKKLEETKVGIICLTKSNLNSNWLLFEAGALSKTRDAQVYTFLYGVEPKNISLPLSQFQHTLFNKEEIKKLVETINKKSSLSGNKLIRENELDEIFYTWYPKLEKALNEIPKTSSTKMNNENIEKQILNEILFTVRSTHKTVLESSYFTSIISIQSNANKIEIVSDITQILINSEIDLISIDVEGQPQNMEINLEIKYESYEKISECLKELKALNNVESAILTANKIR